MVRLCWLLGQLPQGWDYVYFHENYYNAAITFTSSTITTMLHNIEIMFWSRTTSTILRLWFGPKTISTILRLCFAPEQLLQCWDYVLVQNNYQMLRSRLLPGQLPQCWSYLCCQCNYQMLGLCLFPGQLVLPQCCGCVETYAFRLRVIVYLMPSYIHTVRYVDQCEVLCANVPFGEILFIMCHVDSI